jgi:hypothetical protein
MWKIKRKVQISQATRSDFHHVPGSVSAVLAMHFVPHGFFKPELSELHRRDYDNSIIGSIHISNGHNIQMNTC